MYTSRLLYMIVRSIYYSTCFYLMFNIHRPDAPNLLLTVITTSSEPIRNLQGTKYSSYYQIRLTKSV